MGERSRAAALLAALVILAILLAGVTSVTVARQPKEATVTRIPAAVPSDGTLLVKVAEVDGTNTSSRVPLGDVDVNVTQPSSGAPSVSGTETNSSGEFQLRLQPGLYYISVSTAQFEQSTSAVIVQNSTTLVNATVTKNSYPAIFASLPDPESSGSVAPWSYISMAVALSPEVPSNVSLFLNPQYAAYTMTTTVTYETSIPAINVGQPTPTPVKLISSHQQAYGGSEVQWLTLQPEEFVQLTGLSSIGLATYAVSMQVTLGAG